MAKKSNMRGTVTNRSQGKVNKAASVKVRTIKHDAKLAAKVKRILTSASMTANNVYSLHQLTALASLVSRNAALNTAATACTNITAGANMSVQDSLKCVNLYTSLNNVLAQAGFYVEAKNYYSEYTLKAGAHPRILLIANT